MAYPNDLDLGLEDKFGSQFSLSWGRSPSGERNAEVAVNDCFDDRAWSSVVLDRDQLLKIAATILVSLSLTGETVNRIIDALDAECAQLPAHLGLR